jgi:pimeloyl-ACP methyl ester carboxylesterase
MPLSSLPFSENSFSGSIMLTSMQRRAFWAIFFLSTFLGIGLKEARSQELSNDDSPPTHLQFPGERLDEWHGFKRHRFEFQGNEAWVVEPRKTLEGGWFTWCLMFPDAFTDRCAVPALLERGFYHVYLSVGNSFGSPASVQQLADFHDFLMERGFAQKAVLIGISRGGLYAHRYAAEHPSRVRVIYGDAPVLDMKSWPGGQGKGKGSPSDWGAMKHAYGFTNEDEALNYKGNPIDSLDPLAQHSIAIIYVSGDADDVVPIEENALLATERYRKLGGTVELIRKPGVGHHPHGLEDPMPVVEFILQHISVSE